MMFKPQIDRERERERITEREEEREGGVSYHEIIRLFSVHDCYPLGSKAMEFGNYAFTVHGCTIAAILIMMLSEL